MDLPEQNKKKYDTKKYNLSRIRVYNKEKTKRTGAHLLLKCGDCDEQLKIFYHNPNTDGDEAIMIEIGGIMGSIDNWRDILFPILGIEKKDNVLLNSDWFTKYRNKNNLQSSKIQMARKKLI